MMTKMRGGRGIILLEILVALLVFAVASLAIFAAFKTALGAWHITQQFTSEQQAARAVLEWLSRRVRLIGVDHGGVGPAIDAAGADEIRYWMGGECHRIYLTAGVIYEQTGPLCATGDSRPLTSDRDAGQLVVTELKFRYFNAATGEDPGVSEILAPVLGADRYQIKRIEIGISIKGLQQSKTPFALTTQAVIRNVR